MILQGLAPLAITCRRSAAGAVLQTLRRIGADSDAFATCSSPRESRHSSSPVGTSGCSQGRQPLEERPILSSFSPGRGGRAMRFRAQPSAGQASRLSALVTQNAKCKSKNGGKRISVFPLRCDFPWLLPTESREILVARKEIALVASNVPEMRTNLVRVSGEKTSRRAPMLKDRQSTPTEFARR